MTKFPELEIVIASQRYSGYNIIVDVRDKNTKEYMFCAKKDVAEKMVEMSRAANTIHDLVAQ